MLLITDILEIVQQKIGNQLQISEDYLINLINEMGQEIKNYCAIKVIPDELRYTWANMVVDYALRYSPEAIAASGGGSGAGGSSSKQEVTGVSLGGISLSFGAASKTSDANFKAAEHAAILMVDFVKNYQKRLQVFRRFRW